MSKRTKTKSNDFILNQKLFFIIIIALLIFLPPFFRGLFFEKEFIIFQLAVIAAFILWLFINFRKKDFYIIKYKYEYFLVGFIAIYFLVTPFAFNQRTALMEAFRYSSYFAMYVLVRDIAYEDIKIFKAIIHTILFTVTFMSLVGFLNYFGVLETEGVVKANRLFSTLQYPNSFAALLGAAIFLGMFNLIKVRGWERHYIITVTYINLIAFVLTFSRAMWLIFPVLYLLAVYITKPEYRLYYILLSLSIIIPSVVISGFVNSYIGIKSLVPCALIFGGLIISNVLMYILAKLNLQGLLITNRILYIFVALVILLTLGAGFVLTSLTEPLVLSNYSGENMATTKSFYIYKLEGLGDYSLVMDVKTERPADVNVWAGRVVVSSIDKSGTRNILKNFYIRETTDGQINIPFATAKNTYYTIVSFSNYYSNTSFMIKQANIIDNVTGKTIESLKLKYRFIPESMEKRIASINFKDNSVQGRLAFFRDAFKIIKDNLIIGVGGGCWKYAYSLYRSFDYWTTETHSYPLQIWIETGTIGFCLALVFISLFFFKSRTLLTETNEEQAISAGIAMFIGTILLHSFIDFDLSLGAVSIMLWCGFALMSYRFRTDAVVSKNKNVQKFIAIIFAFVILAGSISIYTASVYANKSVEAFKTLEFEDAYKYQQKAVKYDFMNTDYRLNLLKLIINIPNIGNEEKHEKIVEHLEKAIRYDTYNWNLYMEKSKYLFSTGRFEEAIKYADEAIKYQPSIIAPYIFREELLYRTASYYLNKEDFDTAEIILKSMMATPWMIKEKSEQLVRSIELSAEFYDYVYKANFLLDNLRAKKIYDTSKKIAMYENFYFDTDGDNLPDLWQIPYQDDKIIKGRMAKEDGVEVFSLTSDNPSFYIQRMDLGLEPSSRYLLAIEGYSKSPEGKMMVIIGSSSGKSEQFRDGYFAFNEESGIYQTTFETTDDITQGNQYIRLYFNGVEDEVILKRVIIMKMN